TGMKDIITGKHFDSMKDGALVCNTGHYDCEINLVDLEARAKGKREIRKDNEEYVMKDGRRIYVLGQGRLINLAAAEGHPSEVMDMSFANQFQGMLKLAREGKTLEKKVYELPPELDQEIAATKLATMGLAIDTLTAEQAAYANDYSAGT
ncbi:MAG: adenosylhomocysteinase, partial [Polyangia bacterium]